MSPMFFRLIVCVLYILPRTTFCRPLIQEHDDFNSSLPMSSSSSLRRLDMKPLDRSQNRLVSRAERERLRKEVAREVLHIYTEFEKTWKPIHHRQTFKQKPSEREILLLGDSLLGLPSSQFGLEKQLALEIQRRQSGFKVMVNLSCRPGARVVSMKEEIIKKLGQRRNSKNPPPDAVLIYWDSDLVDVDDPNVPEVKQEYTKNLILLLKTAQSEIGYVAIAGPTFSKNRGELPEEWKKDETYETYVMVNIL